MTEHILGVLAVAGPVAGLIIGAGVGVSKKRIVPLAAKGYLYGCLGLLMYVTWSVDWWNDHYDRYVRTPTSWKKDLNEDMRELVSAETAEKVVRRGCTVLIVAAVAGISVSLLLRNRRAMTVCQMALLVGVLIRPLWSAYNWHCRYDPVTGYFGLEKVRVLGVNAVMFVATGAAMGIVWALVSSRQSRMFTSAIAKKAEKE